MKQAQPSPLLRLRSRDWQHIARFLKLRDIHRLGRVCTQLRDIEVQLLRSVCLQQLAQSVAKRPAPLPAIGAPPATALRLTGHVSALLPGTLKPAPHIRQLDLRALNGAEAGDLIQLAELHSGASILLSPEQQTLIQTHVFRQSRNARKLLHPSASTLEITGAIDHVIHKLPDNLLQNCTLGLCMQSIQNNSSIHDTPASRSHDRLLATLGACLLKRCEDKALIPSPSRLFLAKCAADNYRWNERVYHEHKLLLLSALAASLRKDAVNDPLTVQTLLKSLAHAMDIEASLKNVSHSEKVRSRGAGDTKLSPQGLLEVLAGWGLNLEIRNADGRTATEDLTASGRTAEARLLDRAIQKLKRTSLDRETSPRSADECQCALS